LHVTALKGDALLFPFTGTGIEYISSQSYEQGKSDLFLDGVYQTTLDGFAESYQAQKVLFSKTGLNNGKHLLKIVNTDTTMLALDAIKIYK